jgi:hypothetical protein
MGTWSMDEKSVVQNGKIIVQNAHFVSLKDHIQHTISIAIKSVTLSITTLDVNVECQIAAYYLNQNEFLSN